jgi:dTDP-glucose pyrophosphorylase
MTRKVQIVMPMAGAGSRFANAGFDTPKPLIEVDGMPMFLKAISSLDAIKAEKEVIFIVRQEHIENQNLEKLIKDAMPEAVVIALHEITRGAAETAFMAKDQLEPSDPVIVMDCDLWFKSESYDNMVNSILEDDNSISAGLITFESSDPRYSYAKVDLDNIVSETAEKRVISNHAITGAYFFSTAEVFINAASILLNQPIDEKMPEYYLSLLYNILIDEGKKVQATYVDRFYSFGTPEELENYQQSIHQDSFSIT